ncbi:MAG: hypothetical protein AVDCRST_MAG22-2038, partial [uncultured Rubrobacteraceae bacterium]
AGRLSCRAPVAGQRRGRLRGLDLRTRDQGRRVAPERRPL